MHRSLFESLEPSKPPLRIGLLLDSRMLPRHYAEIIGQVIECAFANLELLVFHPRSKRRRNSLYDLYAHCDRLITDRAPTIDCSSRLEGIDSIEIEAIPQIRATQLDVLVNFSSSIPAGEILSSAKHGVWDYHYGDTDFYRGGPECFWEVYEKNPLTGVVLQILPSDQNAGGHILAKGYFPTVLGISQAKNLVAPASGSSTFLLQKLRELHGRGWDALNQSCVPSSAYRGKRALYTAPTNAELVKWLVPTIIKKALARVVHRNRKEVTAFWWLAVRVGAAPLETTGDTQGFSRIDAPRGHFYADPFFFENSGKLWLFFEDYLYSGSRGTLACAEFKDGKLGDVIPVLDKPYHLSFPCVFRDGDTIYMIPETQDNLTVDIYRAINFPRQWEHVKTLYDGSAVDTLVWHKEGIWYFFCTLKEPPRGDGMQLWIFMSDSPTGNWRTHPASPISTDIRSSRNGGAIFERNGRLFRPSQDCAISYGHGFWLNEILVLSPTEYKEEPRVKIEPTWAPSIDGTHSYAQFGDIEVIDALQLVQPHEVT